MYLFACERKDLKTHFFNTNSELLQNHTEKQITIPCKITINWLLNDI